MNKQQLAAKIWATANKLRSKIEANEYKDYILGFIFYKFLSDKEEQLLLKDGWTADNIKDDLNESNTEDVEYLKGTLGYFISYKHLASTWLNPEFEFDASIVTDALNAFERNISETHKNVFENIFKTLKTGLSKLGESNATRTKAIINLLKLIKDIPTDDSQDYDVLGFIYEYLISNFAASAGKKGGEFYTPHEVALMMAEIVTHHLKDKKKIEIYDPTSGSGSLLINIGRAASKHLRNRDSIKYYAQELIENTYNLTRMNLVMRGIKPENIQVRCGDTLAEDWPMANDYERLRVDAVVSNPPYSQNWDSKDYEFDSRYANFGIAPKGKADYAFLLHDLYHVKNDGIMTIVLPHGVLFRGNEEAEIRKNLIEKNHIDAIIGLPANIFFGTGIPTIVMVLRQKREHTDTLFIDASRLSIKAGKQNKLTASDIRRITDTYFARTCEDKTFARVVSREEIRENGYNLNIPRYIESPDRPEPWDIHSIMFGGIPQSEIDTLQEYWDTFPTLRNQLFISDSTPYAQLADADNIKAIISSNTDVQVWLEAYKDAINQLPAKLHNLLLNSMDKNDIDLLHEKIIAEIFDKVSPAALIDKYYAYQELSDIWSEISTDYEIIQTEGFAATRVIEPNMVLQKKKDSDEEEEVQKGFKGKILPFDFVQYNLLNEDWQKCENAKYEVTACENEAELNASLIDEDDLQEDFYDFDKQKFVSKGLKAKVKQIRKNLGKATLEEDSFEAKFLRYSDSLDKLSAAKKEAKKLDTELLEKTMDLLPTLSDEVVIDLLHKKWIDPLCESLHSISHFKLNRLVRTMTYLRDKYSYSLSQIEADKAENATILCGMIDSLIGDEYSIKGLSAFKNVLGGYQDE